MGVVPPTHTPCDQQCLTVALHMKMPDYSEVSSCKAAWLQQLSQFTSPKVTCLLSSLMVLTSMIL